MENKVDGATWIRVMILVAIIGCIGALGSAFIGIVPDLVKTPIISTNIVSVATDNPNQNSTTIPASSEPVNPTINTDENNSEFLEDFEDGSADGFKNKVGLWTVMSEANGNKVLDINSMDSSVEYPSIEFGNSSWNNFIFECRVNIVDYSSSNDAPLTSLLFRGAYRVAFTPYWKGFDLVYNNGGWNILSGRTTITQKNKWYTVRVEANDLKINVYLDGVLTISETATHKSSGSFGFGTWTNTHTQFDDVSITPINK